MRVAGSVLVPGISPSVSKYSRTLEPMLPDSLTKSDEHQRAKKTRHGADNQELAS